MPGSKTNACLGVVLAMLSMPAATQSVRDTIAGARLAPGYAGLLNMAAAPDLSTAHYDVEDGSNLDIDVYRYGYESSGHPASDAVNLHWRATGGYLSMNTDFATGAPSGGGAIASKWSAYSLTAGPFARIQLGHGLSVVPALDVGVAQLENRAGYSGTAIALQPVLDGLLFNWRTNAWLVTPSLGLDWVMANESRTIAVRSRVGWSKISSFDATDPVLTFDETAGSYSIRAEHAAPTGRRWFDRPLGWVVLGSYAGFYGPNRRALGFTSVAELGLGVEAPLSAGEDRSRRLRIGASYLFGPAVSGWTISVGLKF